MLWWTVERNSSIVYISYLVFGFIWFDLTRTSICVTIAVEEDAATNTLKADKQKFCRFFMAYYFGRPTQADELLDRVLVELELIFEFIVRVVLSCKKIVLWNSTTRRGIECNFLNHIHLAFVELNITIAFFIYLFKKYTLSWLIWMLILFERSLIFSSLLEESNDYYSLCSLEESFIFIIMFHFILYYTYFCILIKIIYSAIVGAWIICIIKM